MIFTKWGDATIEEAPHDERISLFCYVLAKLGSREEALTSSLVKDGCGYVSLDWKSVPTH